MTNIIEEAVLYATVMHQGMLRKLDNTPFIMHPLEVAQILNTLTDDQEIIAAGILHDIVEDTFGTIDEIEKRFGSRVAFLVSHETEKDHPGESRAESWKRRKEDSLKVLAACEDEGVRLLWIADKLSNLRSLAREYSKRGDTLWDSFHQRDSKMHLWYYQSVARLLEPYLENTEAFRELVSHIRSIWPGASGPDELSD